jgi:hypothetical protein
MALNANQIPVYGITPKTAVGVLNGSTAGSMGTTTNAVTVLTAGSNGCIIDSLVMNTTSTAVVNVFVSILTGSTVKPLGIVPVAASSGNLTNALSVDALSSSVLNGMTVDQNGKRIIRLAAGDILQVSVLANLTGICYVTAQYTDL